MKKDQIVLNTLVYADRVAKGKRQSELLNEIKAHTIKNVEIRREYIQNFDGELNELNRLSKERDLILLYSIPEVIFKDGKVAVEEINQYLREAKQMNCRQIKLNIGNYDRYSGDLVADLKPLTETGIQITVENDQSNQSGTLRPILTFLADCKERDIRIDYVFDIANWCFVGEDPVANAKQLAPYTVYIHVKDVNKGENGNWTVVPLDKGTLDWRNIVSLLPPGLKIALEYPCANELVIQEGIDKLVSLN